MKNESINGAICLIYRIFNGGEYVFICVRIAEKTPHPKRIETDVIIEICAYESDVKFLKLMEIGGVQFSLRSMDIIIAYRLHALFLEFM